MEHAIRNVLTNTPLLNNGKDNNITIEKYNESSLKTLRTYNYEHAYSGLKNQQGKYRSSDCDKKIFVRQLTKILRKQVINWG
jgi:hypothetical protein